MNHTYTRDMKYLGRYEARARSTGKQAKSDRIHTEAYIHAQGCLVVRFFPWKRHRQTEGELTLPEKPGTHTEGRIKSPSETGKSGKHITGHIGALLPRQDTPKIQKRKI